MDMSFVYLLEMAGTAAFAVSGALAASRKKMDIFGFCVLALMPAVGGGTIGTAGAVERKVGSGAGCTGPQALTKMKPMIIKQTIIFCLISRLFVDLTINLRYHVAYLLNKVS